MDNFDLRNYLKNNLLIEEIVKDLSKQEVMGIGFTSKEEVNNLSFDVSIKTLPSTTGILLHQIIEKKLN